MPIVVPSPMLPAPNNPRHSTKSNGCKAQEINGICAHFQILFSCCSYCQSSSRVANNSAQSRATASISHHNFSIGFYSRDDRLQWMVWLHSLTELKSNRIFEPTVKVQVNLTEDFRQFSIPTQGQLKGNFEIPNFVNNFALKQRNMVQNGKGKRFRRSKMVFESRMDAMRPDLSIWVQIS